MKRKTGFGIVNRFGISTPKIWLNLTGYHLKKRMRDYFFSNSSRIFGVIPLFFGANRRIGGCFRILVWFCDRKYGNFLFVPQPYYAPLHRASSLARTIGILTDTQNQ